MIAHPFLNIKADAILRQVDLPGIDALAASAGFQQVPNP
jgi:hypothetical protein